MSFPLTTTQATYCISIDGIVIIMVEMNSWGRSIANDLDTVLNDIRMQLGDLTSMRFYTVTAWGFGTVCALSKDWPSPTS